jgi:hypothetical protein
MLSICCIWRKTTYDDGFKIKDNRDKRWKNWRNLLQHKTLHDEIIDEIFYNIKPYMMKELTKSSTELTKTSTT